MKIASPAPKRLPAIVRLLIDSRIGADETWSAEVVVEASRGDLLVGCCAIDFVESVAILHSLAIDKPMRRAGIGRALVEHCLQIARDRQTQCIVVLTMFWNVNFFRKCGFQTTSRKLLPVCLAANPLVCDPAFRRATPMILQIDGAALV